MYRSAQIESSHDCTYFQASATAASRYGFWGPQTASVVDLTMTRRDHSRKPTVTGLPVLSFSTSAAKTPIAFLLVASRSLPGPMADMMNLGQLLLKPCSLCRSWCIILTPSLLMPTRPPASAAMAPKLTVRQCRCNTGMSSVAFTMYIR